MPFKSIKEAYPGKEYIEDLNRTTMRFDLQIYSHAELLPFEIDHQKHKITGSQKGIHLIISFIEKLPRKLIDDLVWGRNNATRYVFGYIFTPMQKVNQEMLRQRYVLGHFLVDTFSAFDISSIKLTNIDEDPTDEIISIPWPPVVTAFPHSSFNTDSEIINTEVFMKDYIDACNDFIKGDYDNCVRRMITSVENSLSFYGLKPKKKHVIWKMLSYFKRRGSSFRATISDLFIGSDFIGHRVVIENILFLYKVRNRITHGSLRIRHENGWWLCIKGLKTLQYFYQFIDGHGEKSRGAYIFHTYLFLDFLFVQLKGKILEQDEMWARVISDGSFDHNKYVIKDDKDMNEWQFGNMLINENEKECVLGNRIRTD